MRALGVALFTLGCSSSAWGALIGADAAPSVARAERPTIAPPASWINVAPIPPAPTAAEGSATIDLLADEQTRFSTDGDTSYFNAIYKIATAKGLDDGSLQLSWDPDLETLTIHHFRIIRDGTPIDLLGDGSKLTIVRRETNLERATLDGQLTATLQPEDIRVGDVIDLAFSRTRRDPAMAGKSEVLTGPRDGVPYGRSRIRLLWPSSKKVTWRTLPGVIQPKLQRSGSDVELISDLSNIVTPRAPQGAPTRFDAVNAIEATEFQNWAAVSALLAPLYVKAATLAAGSAVKAEAARIAAATTDPKMRAQLALQLVQEQVRYLFLGMNDGGYVPAAADLTWSRRFGDCKGKTVLLVALLRELGIDARAVLVNTDRGDFVAARLPAMGAFDHVIVEARIGGKSYWMDGTRLGDRQLDQLRTPNYHVGLPITPGGAGLVPLVPEPLTQPSETISLVLDATKGIEVPANAEGEMRFRGDAAVDMRVKYADMSATDRDLALRKKWRDIYDFVSPTAVGTREDAKTGDFLLTVTGTARMDWAADVGTRWYEVDRARLGWKIDTTRDGELDKDAPFAFDYPDWWQSREVIKLPNDGAGFRLQGGSIDRTIGGLYAFHREVEIDKGVVTMEADTRALAGELPASRAEQTRREMAELAQSAVFVRMPEDYVATDGDIATLKDDKPALVKAYLQRAVARYDHGQTDAGLADADAVIALDPTVALAYAIRALALSMRDRAQAQIAADRAVTLDAKLLLGWRAKGMVDLLSGRAAEADKDFSNAIEIGKRDARSFVGRATARFSLDHDADALTDIDTALSIEPTLPVQVLRASILMRLNRSEDALAAADKAVDAQPNDEAARTSRAEMRALLGQRSEAIKDIDAAIARHPTAALYVKRADLRPLADRAGREGDVAQALLLDPKFTAALHFRIRDALARGDLAAADAAITAMEKSGPKGPMVQNLRATLLARQGRAQDGLRMMDVMVAADPANPSRLNERCWFKASFNLSLETALADCNAALKAKPDQPAFLDSRGLVKFRLGDFDGAMADYDAALQRFAYLPASLYGRALARARRGDLAGARSDLVSARRVDPDIDTEFAGFGLGAPATLTAEKE